MSIEAVDVVETCCTLESLVRVDTWDMECFLVICGLEMFEKEGCFKDDFVDGLIDENAGEEESHAMCFWHTTAIGVPNILFFVFGTFQNLFFDNNTDYKTS